MRLRPLALLTPLAAVSRVSGCATKIDSGKAEDQISSAIKDRARPCRADVHADAPFVHTHEAAAAIVAGHKGTQYECKADSDRGKAVVTVTLSDERGAFDYKVRSA